MAILYVSNSASNGYLLGDDGNDGSTKALAFLTVEAAETAASNDDEIIVNDGTYTMTTYLDVGGVTGLTISPENAYAVTFKQGGGQTRVVHQKNTAGDLTIGKIILDAEGASNVISSDSAVNTNGLTLDGTYLDNAAGTTLSSSFWYNLTMKNGWRITGSSLTRLPINLTVPAAGNIHIYDGTIDTAGMNHSTGGGIKVTGSVGNVDLQIYNISYSMDVANGTPAPRLIDVYGCTDVLIHTITGGYTGTITKTSGIVVNNDATACTSCEIYDIDVTCDDDSNTNAGYGVLVGADGTGANDNSITGVNVRNAKVKGVTHGIMFGWITGARANGCEADYVSIGHLVKGAVSCEMSGMIAEHVTGSAFRMKTATTCNLTNGVHTITTGYDCITEYATDTNVSGTFANNIVDADIAITTRHSVVDVGSVANFYNSNYYSAISVHATPWIYQGTTYATVTLWNGAATVTGCTEIDPDFVDSANDDYTVQTAALSTGGYLWWGLGARPEGYDGEPFADRNISVGAIQGKDSTNHPFHPVNL